MARIPPHPDDVDEMVSHAMRFRVCFHMLNTIGRSLGGRLGKMKAA